MMTAPLWTRVHLLSLVVSMKYVEDGRVLGSEYWGQSDDANDANDANDLVDCSSTRWRIRDLSKPRACIIEAINPSLASSIAFPALRC